jgi:hypothetical protein
MEFIKRNTVLLLILIIGLGIGFYGKDIWEYLKSFGKSDEPEVVVQTPPPAYAERKFPAGFSSEGLREKLLDLDNDGVMELLLTSFDGAKAQVALVDSRDNAKTLSGVFNFPQSGFAGEFLFKPTEAPEIYQTMDLNANGKEEMIFDLKDYGAYTTTYGIVIFSNKTFSWLELEEKDGKMRPAIFRDGASVRNANVFKTLLEEKAIVEVAGAGDGNNNWTWEVSAYKWNGEVYKYDQALSAKILAEQPKKIIDGEPVF